MSALRRHQLILQCDGGGGRDEDEDESSDEEATSATSVNTSEEEEEEEEESESAEESSEEENEDEEEEEEEVEKKKVKRQTRSTNPTLSVDRGPRIRVTRQLIKDQQPTKRLLRSRKKSPAAGAGSRRPQIFPCPSCKKEFNNKASLGRHSQWCKPKKSRLRNKKSENGETGETSRASKTKPKQVENPNSGPNHNQGPDGVPVKRKRGRPRKTPVEQIPQQHNQTFSHSFLNESSYVDEQSIPEDDFMLNRSPESSPGVPDTSSESDYEQREFAANAHQLSNSRNQRLMQETSIENSEFPYQSHYGMQMEMGQDEMILQAPERPVSCEKCLMTYRTVQGYNNHLPSCVAYSSSDEDVDVETNETVRTDHVSSNWSQNQQNVPSNFQQRQTNEIQVEDASSSDVSSSSDENENLQTNVGGVDNSKNSEIVANQQYGIVFDKANESEQFEMPLRSQTQVKETSVEENEVEIISIQNSVKNNDLILNQQVNYRSDQIIPPIYTPLPGQHQSSLSSQNLSLGHPYTHPTSQVVPPHEQRQIPQSAFTSATMPSSTSTVSSTPLLHHAQTNSNTPTYTQAQLMQCTVLRSSAMQAHQQMSTLAAPPLPPEPYHQSSISHVPPISSQNLSMPINNISGQQACVPNSVQNLNAMQLPPQQQLPSSIQSLPTVQQFNNGFVNLPPQSQQGLGGVLQQPHHVDQNVQAGSNLHHHHQQQNTLSQHGQQIPVGSHPLISQLPGQTQYVAGNGLGINSQQPIQGQQGFPSQPSLLQQQIGANQMHTLQQQPQQMPMTSLQHSQHLHQPIQNAPGIANQQQFLPQSALGQSISNTNPVGNQFQQQNSMQPQFHQQNAAALQQQQLIQQQQMLQGFGNGSIMQQQNLGAGAVLQPSQLPFQMQPQQQPQPQQFAPSHPVFHQHNNLVGTPPQGQHTPQNNVNIHSQQVFQAPNSVELPQQQPTNQIHRLPNQPQIINNLPLQQPMNTVQQQQLINNLQQRQPPFQLQQVDQHQQQFQVCMPPQQDTLKNGSLQNQAFILNPNDLSSGKNGVVYLPQLQNQQRSAEPVQTQPGTSESIQHNQQHNNNNQPQAVQLLQQIVDASGQTYIILKSSPGQFQANASSSSAPNQSLNGLNIIAGGLQTVQQQSQQQQNNSKCLLQPGLNGLTIHPSSCNGTPFGSAVHANHCPCQSCKEKQQSPPVKPTEKYILPNPTTSTTSSVPSPTEYITQNMKPILPNLTGIQRHIHPAGNKPGRPLRLSKQIPIALVQQPQQQNYHPGVRMVTIKSGLTPCGTMTVNSPNVVLQQQQQINNLAGVVASIDGSNRANGMPMSNPNIAVVRPMENPLQKLTDQISQIGANFVAQSPQPQHPTSALQTPPSTSLSPIQQEQQQISMIANPVQELPPGPHLTLVTASTPPPSSTVQASVVFSPSQLSQVVSLSTDEESPAPQPLPQQPPTLIQNLGPRLMLVDHGTPASIPVLSSPSRTSTPSSPATTPVRTPVMAGVKRKLPATPENGKATTGEPSNKSIKVTLKRKEGGDSYSINQISGSTSASGTMKSLKIKGQIKSGDQAGITTDVVVVPCIHTVPVNDSEMSDENNGTRTTAEDDNSGESSKEGKPPMGRLLHRAVIVYEVQSNGAVLFRSSDVRAIWSYIFETVQGTRLNDNLPPLPYPATNVSVPHNDPEADAAFNKLGLTHRAVQFLLEQLPGRKGPKTPSKQVVSTSAATTASIPEKPQPETPNSPQVPCENVEETQQPDTHVGNDDGEDNEESKFGCARLEQFSERKPFDVFGWLCSKHRVSPGPCALPEESAKNLAAPVSMRYRKLKEKGNNNLMVWWSKIHGRGLMTLREREKGEMIIEYAGEVIRPIVCDIREKYYESKSIGCYMFRVNNDQVIDATMKGNAARFINHSCEPNCEARTVKISGRDHILIFALKRIERGTELTYDYKFEKEEEKIPCTCKSAHCRKYLN